MLEEALIMFPNRRTDVVAFRTNLLHEADLVANALTAGGIPHYRREDGGPQFGLPALPAQGLRATFSIHVPSRKARAAAKLISALPVDHSPSLSPWGFKPTSEMEAVLRHQAWFAVVGVALALLYAFYSIIRELLR